MSNCATIEQLRQLETCQVPPCQFNSHPWPFTARAAHSMLPMNTLSLSKCFQVNFFRVLIILNMTLINLFFFYHLKMYHSFLFLLEKGWRGRARTNRGQKSFRFTRAFSGVCEDAGQKTLNRIYSGDVVGMLCVFFCIVLRSLKLEYSLWQCWNVNAPVSSDAKRERTQHCE